MIHAFRLSGFSEDNTCQSTISSFKVMEYLPKFLDGSPVPVDGQFHADPSDPKTSIRYLELWMPPGVLTIIGGGSTSRLGLLADGTVLKFSLARDDKFSTEGLEVEDAVLRSLGNHERLVQYLGKTQDGLRFKRARHGDSANFISRARPGMFTHELGQKWSVQAAEAIASIHMKGVIHCDIHPNNFLVDDHFDLRLCDFSGSIFGDLDGGAMESVRFFLPRDPHDPPTVKSDIFALGSVIYFFVAGNEPYHTLPEDEVTARYGRGEFPDVTAITTGEVICGCWKGQYESARDVWRSLQEFNTTRRSDSIVIQ